MLPSPYGGLFCALAFLWIKPFAKLSHINISTMSHFRAQDNIPGCPLLVGIRIHSWSKQCNEGINKCCNKKKIYFKMTDIKILMLDRFLLQHRERRIISAHPFPNMGWKAASLWASGVSASFPVEREDRAACAVAG